MAVLGREHLLPVALRSAPMGRHIPAQGKVEAEGKAAALDQDARNAFPLPTGGAPAMMFTI